MTSCVWRAQTYTAEAERFWAYDILTQPLCAYGLREGERLGGDCFPALPLGEGEELPSPGMGGVGVGGRLLVRRCPRLRFAHFEHLTRNRADGIGRGLRSTGWRSWRRSCGRRRTAC